MSRLLLRSPAIVRRSLSQPNARYVSNQSNEIKIDACRGDEIATTAEEERQKKIMTEACIECHKQHAVFKRRPVSCMSWVPWEEVLSWPDYAKQASLEGADESPFTPDGVLNDKIGFWSIKLKNLPLSAQSTKVVARIGPYDLSPGQLNKEYRQALDTAVENGYRTMMIPCIKSKKHGYTALRETFIALTVARDWMKEGNLEKIDKIICVVLDEFDIGSYEQVLMKCFPI